MGLSPLDWGQLVTLLLMAAALGMDALSLGIGIGLKGIRLINILRVSAIVALFHTLLPLMGMIMGQYFSMILGELAVTVGGGLLILLGAHMIYSAFLGEAIQSIVFRNIWGLLAISLMVSLDSFSVGVSMGMVVSDIWLTIFMFGFFGGLMSMIGLAIGRKFGHWTGNYGEALGGVVLLVFGLYFIF